MGAPEPPAAASVYEAAFPAFSALAGPLPAETARLVDFGDDPALCEALLTLEGAQEPGLDRKGCGAYLVNRLGWDVGCALAALDLVGRDISGLDAGQVAVRSSQTETLYEGVTYRYLVTGVSMVPLPGGQAGVEAAGAAIERLFAPLVAGAAATSTLSAGALRRLVADGVSAAYLHLAQTAGETGRGLDRVGAILRRPGSKLDFRQLSFLDIHVPAAESPSGIALRETFRERAGCCRYYTSDRAEGAYCGTCVHRKDREAYLRDYMLGQARAAG